MRLVIAVATANAHLRDYLDKNRAQALPREHIRRGYFADKNARISVQIFALAKTTGVDDLELWVRRLAANADRLILLIDESARPLVCQLEDAYFIADLQFPYGKILQNQFHALIAPVLRHFIAYSRHFDDLGCQRVLLLPLEVFIAPELLALRARMTINKLAPAFYEDLERLIALLNQRARPKSRKSYRTVYLVDDRPLWFRYGPERHKIVETASPPHSANCWHLSRFRWGCAYDDRLHHNVDDDTNPTKVYGQFTTCHGDLFTARGESHLGVFPNGFI